MIEPIDLCYLMHAAYHARRTVADVVQDNLRHCNEHATRGDSYGAQMKRRRADWLVALETYASLRGELGQLPPLRDRTVPCEPAIAAWAQRLALVVEERVGAQHG